jgi:hypothetical protein
MGFDRMTERLIRKDTIVVLPADALVLDKAPVLEVHDDTLNGPFGDPDARGNFPQDERWILRQQDEDVRMIRKKRPAVRPVSGCRHGFRRSRIAAATAASTGTDVSHTIRHNILPDRKSADADDQTLENERVADQSVCRTRLKKIVSGEIRQFNREFRLAKPERRDLRKKLEAAPEIYDIQLTNNISCITTRVIHIVLSGCREVVS